MLWHTVILRYNVESIKVTLHIFLTEKDVGVESRRDMRPSVYNCRALIVNLEAAHSKGDYAKQKSIAFSAS